ncbi:transglycosylase domain-containing protein [Modestobacter sp. SYSU DS0290]
MPPHDETARVSSGPVRRPPAARATAASGGRTTSARGGTGSSRGGASSSRGGASSSRGGTSAPRSGTPGRPAGARPASGGGGGRPPGNRPPTAKGGPGGGGGKRKRTPKQRRRRWYKVIAGAFLSMLVLLGVFVGVVYATTEVPSPESVQNAQTTVVYYSDGVTEMARLAEAGGNRTNVGLDQISEAAQNAILAAENRSFYTDPGISFTGIMRAAWNNLTGGSTQGGSTITQQYVKNAFLSSEQTFSRKFKELFLAVKLDNEYSKEEILENYLNTIYFGRGAYGIEAAANTFFGVKAADLTAEQGAVLAVQVRSPSSYDPEADPEAAQDRWGRVLDGMVEEGWLDAAARAAAQYPAVRPNTGSNLGYPEGPEGLVARAAVREVANMGYDSVESSGLRIVTTLDKGKQDAAVAAVNEVMAGEPDELQEALVAVDPRTGGIVAYYGNERGTPGEDGKAIIDYAQAQRPPGSSMKPYVLATALEQGIGVEARRDGTSPQVFPQDRTQPVRNSGNAQCAACTLKEAMTKSLNTTYYGLALETGPTEVRQTALDATGLPEVWSGGALDGQPVLADGNGNTGGAIGIGQYDMRPIDQAVGFATFAAGGVRHDPHFVAEVRDSTGAVLKANDGSASAYQAVEPNVASDVTFALEDVAGASRLPLDGNRPVASKTGTQGLDDEDNSDAWMVGYTPSLSAAVWIGTGSTKAIRNVQGRIIYGSGLPGEIWQEFMNAALAGTPVEQLPTRPLIKGDTGEGVPEPTPTPTPTQTETETSQPPVESTQAPAPSPTAQATGAAEARARERARQEAERAAQEAERARQEAERVRQQEEEAAAERARLQELCAQQPSRPECALGASIPTTGN